MNRDHLPCGRCSKFVPGQTGHCTGFDRPTEATDSPCVLFLDPGSKEARVAARSEHDLLAEIAKKQQRKAETISRASAPTAAPT